VPREILEPAFDRLALTGYAQRTRDQFWLTPAGAREVELVRADTLEWLTSGLAQSSGLQVRPDRVEVRKALDKITQDVLVQRDWTDDATQAMQMRPPRRAVPPRRRPPPPPARPVAPQQQRPPLRAPRAPEPPTAPIRPPYPPPPPRGPRPPGR
jgi:hypothetical protein